MTVGLAAGYAPVVWAAAAWIPATVLSTDGGDLYGGQIAWSKYALWMLLMPGGYAYVALGPYNGRARPFASRTPGTYQLLRLLLFAAVMFWAAPIRTIAALGDPSATNLLTPGWPATIGEVVLYNWSCYVVPFIAGCNYWYLDGIPTLNRYET